MTYNSVAADPLPIILVENTLSSSGSVPSSVSAQLTYNASGGTTWYYNTSTFNPGDVEQIALQATGTSSLATGRYSYTAVVADSGSTPTTLTGSFNPYQRKHQCIRRRLGAERARTNHVRLGRRRPQSRRRRQELVVYG